MTERVRQGIMGRRFSSNAEADAADAAFWRRLSPEERVLLAWQLSVEQRDLVRSDPDEPGLSRSVTSVRRRSR